MVQIVKYLPYYRRPEFKPWAGKIPGKGNGYPLQYSCLENSMDRGVWRAMVHGVTELDMTVDTTEQLTLSLPLNVISEQRECGYKERNCPLGA